MNEKERDGYIASIKNKSDRELLEVNMYYQRKQSDYLKSINGYLFVIMALFILAAVGGILISLN